MINLLENSAHYSSETSSLEEDELISLIYRFASKKDEWFNLLLSLSNCISVSENLPNGHPYRDISARVMKHLKTAIKLSAQLNISEKSIYDESTLNSIPMPAAIINEAGRIIEINHSAESFFENSENWNIDQGYLSAQHLRLTTELFPLIDEQHFSVISLPLEPIDTRIEPLAFIKENTDKPKLLHLSALPNNGENCELSKLFYLCFQTQQSALIDAESLKGHYQLTDTEALVVVTLMSEVSTKKAANKLKLKDATVRGHLTSIYQKMNVSRKPELIRKVLLYRLAQPHQTNCAQTLSTPQTFSDNHKHEYIYLKDGRRLSYFDHLKPKDFQAKRATDENHRNQTPTQTIVLLHNLMGSAMELPPGAEKLFEEANIRIIVPERPGYGDSDIHPGRTHRDWVSDIEQLLDHLEISSVKLLAHSIGGAYALAMAEFAPHRVERIAMVNAMPRAEDILTCKNIPTLITAVNRSLKFAPFLIEPILKMAVGKDIEHFYSQQLNYIRPTIEGRAADINLLKTPLYRDYSIANLKHSAKQGINIWAEELKLSFAKLDFAVTNTDVEYQFWHGGHDDVIPVEAAENLAKIVNTSDFNHLESETHFLFFRRFKEVIEALLI